jgi:hypothetical protein
VEISYVAGRRIVAIGDLDQADDGFMVDGTTFPAATHRALKISGIVFS